MVGIFYSEDFSVASQTIIGSVLYLVSIFGTVGNISLIIALRLNSRLKNTSNLLTISLAASDVLISAIAMPISGFAALNFDAETPETSGLPGSSYNYTPECKPRGEAPRLPPFLCTLNGLVIYVSSRISTWTLAGMALERYLAVLHPLKYNRVVTKKRMFSIIIMIWIVSLLVELPQVAGWFPFVYYYNAFGCLSPSYHHVGYNNIGFTIFSVSKKVLLTLLPTPLIGYCYYRILGVSFKSKHTDVILKKRFGENGYHKSKHKIEPVTSTNVPKRLRSMQMTQESIAGIISKTNEKYQCYKKSFIWLIIVISYVICWSPVSVTGIAMNFLDAYCEEHFPRGLIIAVFVIAIINSCVNPVIYGFFHHQVRKTFVDIFCCRSTQNRLRAEQREEQSQVIGPLSATLSLTVSSDETDRSRIFSASNPRRSIATPSTDTAVYRGNSFASAIIVKSRNSFTNTNGANTRNSFTRTTSLIRRNSFGKTESDNNYYMNTYTRNSFSKTSARSKMGCIFGLQRSPSLDQSDINTAHNNMHISSAYHG